MDSEIDRFDVRPLATAHWRSFRAKGQSRPTLAVQFILVGLPLALGVCSFLLQAALPATAVAPLLTATGLLVGAFISSFVLLTNLRVKVGETDAWKFRSKVARLIASTAAASLYSACLCFLIAAGLVVGMSVPALQSGVAHTLGTALLVALLAHLAANLTTILRRLFGVYYALFKADFDPEFELVPAVTVTNASTARHSRHAS